MTQRGLTQVRTPRAWGSTATGLYSWANFGLWTLVLGLAMLLLWPFDRDRRGMARAMRLLWGRANFWTNPLWTVHPEGLQHVGPGPYVVVSNHQSITDIPNLLRFLPPLVIGARDGVFRAPGIGGFLRLSGQVHSGRFAEEAAAALDRGLSVLVFAEGTRSPDGHLQRFRNGAFHLAREVGVPVLPVVIDGSRDLLAKGDLFPTKARIRVRVAVLPPVDPASEPSTPELKSAVHRAMKDVLEGG